MSRKQLNVRISPAVHGRIDRDRKNTFATKDIIAEVAFEHWFSSIGAEQRERFYKAHFRKPYAKAA